MDEGRLKMPPYRDMRFYQRRKHDKWREVPAPALPAGAHVFDTHAHVHMLPDPALELARAAANGVSRVCMIVDPSEDGTRPFDELDAWCRGAGEALREIAPDGDAAAPGVCVAVGVHPHNARLYDEGMEALLMRLAADPRVVAIGEIGLDYHYDFSPRDSQRRVFRRQIERARELDLPIALHLRGGEDPVAADAHREAFEILREEAFPGERTLLHCCALPPDELMPWIEAGCYIAYGGAVTFKKADDARAGAVLVPPDRLLTETDAPYMTPEPMRGAACTPAHTVFTAALLADLFGCEKAEDRSAFYERLAANASRFFERR